MAIGLGIIGCGVIGNVHAAAAKRAGQRIVACFDADSARAEALTKSHGGRAAKSLDDLLNDSEVQAVVVATPNDTHCDLALRVLTAGKDLLLEKPMAMNVEQCRQIAEAAQMNNRIVQLSFVCRMSPTALVAKQYIDSGRLGNIYHARASLFRRRGIPGLGHWFTTKSRSGGGVLIDIGVHLIDLLLHMTGATPKRVSGQIASKFGHPIGNYRYTDMWAGPPKLDGTFDVDDLAAGLVRCDDNVTLDIAVTWAANAPTDSQPDGITILGDRGGLFLHLWDGRITFTSEIDGRLGDFSPDMPKVNAWDDAWQKQHERFAEAVANRSQPMAGAHDGLIAQAVLDGWYESAAQQREVEITIPELRDASRTEMRKKNGPGVVPSPSFIM